MEATRLGFRRSFSFPSSLAPFAGADWNGFSVWSADFGGGAGFQWALFAIPKIFIMVVRDVNCLVATARTLLDVSQTAMITAVLDAKVRKSFRAVQPCKSRDACRHKGKCFNSTPLGGAGAAVGVEVALRTILHAAESTRRTPPPSSYHLRCL
ncbi:uncharacterized protein [Miscanthus floridulus]|uniref:uncharacterized protein n=1 Tax=Miscanthus floridulus TaxID=154761 RepID=UPI003459194C